MKKIFSFLIAFALIFSFAGCADNKAKFYEANAVADALNANLEFGEELEKSTADIAYSIYGIDSALCTDAAFYSGSGATADEIAVFNCVDENAVNSVADAVEARLDYLHEGYSSYGPQEVPKIESAAVITEGNTVILCICNNAENVKDVADSVAE